MNNSGFVYLYNTANIYLKELWMTEQDYYVLDIWRLYHLTLQQEPLSKGQSELQPNLSLFLFSRRYSRYCGWVCFP
jgi:hypothetical protein